MSGPISSSVDVGCIFCTPFIGRSSSPSFSGDYGRVEAVIARGVARRRKAPLWSGFTRRHVVHICRYPKTMRRMGL